VNAYASNNDGRLAGRSVAILMETDYVEPEIDYYLRRFAEEGARVELLTRLWGRPSLTFVGHEYQRPLTVDGDLEAVDDARLRGFDALIVPSGMVSDRLRYAERPGDLAPAVQLLRRAFAEPGVLKGLICHGLWLAAAIPEVVRDRPLTCHNNLIADAANMGARYTDQDVVVHGDLVTARSADHCHLFAHTLIEMIAARMARGGQRWWRDTVPSALPAPRGDGNGAVRALPRAGGGGV
jgi:protease I